MDALTPRQTAVLDAVATKRTGLDGTAEKRIITFNAATLRHHGCDLRRLLCGWLAGSRVQPPPPTLYPVDARAYRRLATGHRRGTTTAE
jgi:hypothetical protein